MKQIKQNKVREKQQQMKINADGNQISMSIVTSRIGKNLYISRVCVCDFFFHFIHSSISQFDNGYSTKSQCKKCERNWKV